MPINKNGDFLEGYGEGFKHGFEIGFTDALKEAEARSNNAEKKLQQMTQICRVFLSDVNVATSAMRETILAIDEGEIDD